MKFIWNYFIWIWPPNFIWTSYELYEKLPDNSCIFPTKFIRSSYEVFVKFIWIESFCYICISSEVHVNFIWNSYVIMCEISKWPWFSYVFHSKFIWHTDQNFQMKFHTNDTNRPSYITNKDWDEITCPFRNFNGASVDKWKWIVNLIPPFIMDVVIYPYWDYR